MQIECEERTQQRLAHSRCWMDTSPLPVPERKATPRVTNTQGFRLEVLSDNILFNSPTLQMGKSRLRQRW